MSEALLTDWLGQEIRPGVQIVYPGRASSSTWMTHGEVLEIVQVADTWRGETAWALRVAPKAVSGGYTRWEHKPVIVRRLDRVTVVRPLAPTDVEIDRGTLDNLVDTITGSMDYGSGFLYESDVDCLRTAALALGKDPAVVTPEEFKAKYAPPHTCEPLIDEDSVVTTIAGQQLAIARCACGKNVAMKRQGDTWRPLYENDAPPAEVAA